MPIPEKLFLIYIGAGAFGAILLHLWLLFVIIRHHEMGRTTKFVVQAALREQSSILVIASSIVSVLCYGYNFSLFWPALFVPRLLGFRRAKASPNRSAFQVLSAAGRHLSFDADYFIWPIAGTFASLVLYGASYSDLPFAYPAAATILWVACIARLVSYTITGAAPALQDVPTYLRRRHSKPRQMFLALLAIEGLGLVLLLPLVASRLSPDSVTFRQDRQILGSFYRPDDWSTLFTTWPPTLGSWVSNGSGLLFNSVLLTHIFRCLLSLRIAGWKDPFQLNDEDRLYLAKDTLDTDDLAQTAEYLDQLDKRSEQSYQLSAQLHLAQGHVDEAQGDVAKRLALLRRSTDRAAVFHEMLSYPRRGNSTIEKAIFRWALDNDVPDEDLAHAVFSAHCTREGSAFVLDFLDSLHSGEPGPKWKTRSNTLREMATTRPVTAGMFLIWALPDEVDEELRLQLNTALEREGDSQTSMTPLRKALISLQIGKRSVSSFESLMQAVGRMVRDGRDQSEIARVLAHLSGEVRSLRKANNLTTHASTLAESWRGIMVEAKMKKNYDHQMQIMMSEVASELKSASAAL